MTKRMKKITAVLLTAVMMLSVTACGGKEDFDAKGYVQAALDAKYQREYDDYAKLLGISADEAKDQMEGEFNNSLAKEITLSGIVATDEEVAQYQQLEADLRKIIKYEVKEPKKDDDDNFKVDVEVTPVDAFAQLEEKFQTKLQEAVNNGTDESGYMGVMLACEKECIENAKELDPVTVTLNVTFKESGNQRVYTVSEDDMMQLDLVMTGQNK